MFSKNSLKQFIYYLKNGAENFFSSDQSSEQNNPPYIAPFFAVMSVFWTVYLSISWIGDIRFPLAMFQILSWDEYQYLPFL